MRAPLSRSFGKAIIAALCALAGGLLATQHNEQTSNADFVTLQVEHVSDGDSLAVVYEDRIQALRLIGIDAPEVASGVRAKRQAKQEGISEHELLVRGQAAAAYVRRFVKNGDRVKVQFDVNKRDRYGRLLGYVFLPSGEMLNIALIRAGLATPLEIGRDLRYHDEIRAAVQKHR